MLVNLPTELLDSFKCINVFSQVSVAYLFQASMIYRAKRMVEARNELEPFGERYPVIINYLDKWGKGCIQAFITWICVSYFCPYDIAICLAISVVPLFDIYFCNLPFLNFTHDPCFQLARLIGNFHCTRRLNI